MDTSTLLQEYAAGPQLLADSIKHVSADMFSEHPVPGTWSIRQVICHLSDAEIVYADRIKRILIEDNPTVFEWSPDDSVTNELCLCRDLSNELDVIRSVRLQMGAILGAQDVEVWQRTAVHSTDGPMTLETVLERITRHIPHHVTFINSKTAALGIS
jgi:uncharacterized damage-inducible protein DinB